MKTKIFVLFAGCRLLNTMPHPPVNQSASTSFIWSALLNGPSMNTQEVELLSVLYVGIRNQHNIFGNSNKKNTSTSKTKTTEKSERNSFIIVMDANLNKFPLLILFISVLCARMQPCVLHALE